MIIINMGNLRKDISPAGTIKGHVVAHHPKLAGGYDSPSVAICHMSGQ